MSDYYINVGVQAMGNPPILQMSGKDLDIPVIRFADDPLLSPSVEVGLGNVPDAAAYCREFAANLLAFADRIAELDAKADAR